MSRVKKLISISAVIILLILTFCPNIAFAERNEKNWRNSTPGNTYNILARDAFAKENYHLAYEYAMKSIKLYARKHGGCGEAYIIAARSCYWIGKPTEGQKLLNQGRSALLYSGQVKGSSGSKSAAVKLYEVSFVDTLKSWKPVGMEVPPDSEIIQFPGYPAIYKFQLEEYYNKYKDDLVKRAAGNAMLGKIVKSLEGVVNPIIKTIQEGKPVTERQAAAATTAVGGLLMLFNLIETISAAAASRARERAGGGKAGEAIASAFAGKTASDSFGDKSGIFVSVDESSNTSGVKAGEETESLMGDDPEILVSDEGKGAVMSGYGEGKAQDTTISVSEESILEGDSQDNSPTLLGDDPDILVTDESKGIDMTGYGEGKKGDTAISISDKSILDNVQGGETDVHEGYETPKDGDVMLSVGGEDVEGTEFEKPEGMDGVSNIFGVAQDSIKGLNNDLADYVRGGGLIEASNNIQDLKGNFQIATNNVDDAVKGFTDAVKNDTHIGLGGQVTHGSEYDKALQDLMNSRNSETKAIQDLADAEKSMHFGNGIKNVGDSIINGFDKGMTIGGVMMDSLSNMMPTVTEDGVLIEGDDWYYAIGKASGSGALNSALGAAESSLGIMELTNYVMFDGSKAGEIISPSGTVSGFFNYITDSLVDYANGTDTSGARLEAGVYGDNVSNFMEAKSIANEALQDPSKFGSEWSDISTNDDFYSGMHKSADEIFKPAEDAGMIKQGASWVGKNIFDGFVSTVEATKDVSQYFGEKSFGEVLEDVPGVASDAYDAAGMTVNDIKETGYNAATKVGGAIKDAGAAALDAAAHPIETATSAYNTVSSAASSTYDKVSSAASGAYSAVSGWFSDSSEGGE